MVISKGDALLKTRPKPKVNVQLRWMSLFSRSSWIKTTASRLSYELDVLWLLASSGDMYGESL